MSITDLAEFDFSDAQIHAEHLRTDHLRAEIQHRTISGGVVSAFSQGCQLALTLGYNAVLARLLSPLDFGLVAMAMTIAGFLQIFKDAGLSTATIQREDITHAQVSNLFWINVGVSGFATAAMMAASPTVAWFFHEPRLVNITIVLASAFLLEGLAVQHFAVLNRQMRFKLVSVIELGSVATGFLIGMVMALDGYRYWSLVGATLSTSAFRAVTAWIVLPWRPKRPTRGTDTRPLVHFGADLTLVGIIYALTRSADGLLIGRFLGSEAVGLYSRATALLTKPMERLTSPIYSVIVPALSRLQNETERYRATFLTVFEGLTIAGCVFTGTFLPLALPLVLVVLGHKWEAAAPIFAALTLAALYLPLATACSWLYTSQGRGRALLTMAALGGVVMVVAFVVALPFGPTGVAMAYSISGVLGQLPLTYYIVGRSGPVTTRDLWSISLRHVPMCFVVMAATWLTKESLLAQGPAAQLLISAMVGGAAGIGYIFAFPRTRQTAKQFARMIRRFRLS